MTTISLNNAFAPLEQLVTLPDRPLHCDAQPVTHDSDEEIIVIDEDAAPMTAATETTLAASNAGLAEAPAAIPMEQQQSQSSSEVSVPKADSDLNAGVASDVVLAEDSTLPRKEAKEAADGARRSDAENQGEIEIDVDDSFDNLTGETRNDRAVDHSVADANAPSSLPVIKQWKKHASTICNGYEMMLDAKVAGTERRNWYCPWSLHCGARAVSDGLISPLRETSTHNHPPEEPPEGAPVKAQNFGICNDYHMIRGSPHIGSTGKLYWRCRWRPCGARALSEAGTAVLVETRPHNHPANEKPPMSEKAPGKRKVATGAPSEPEATVLDSPQKLPESCVQLIADIIEQVRQSSAGPTLIQQGSNPGPIPLGHAQLEAPPPTAESALPDIATTSSPFATTADVDAVPPERNQYDLSVLQRTVELPASSPITIITDGPGSNGRTDSSRSSTATPHEPVWRRGSVATSEDGEASKQCRRKPAKRKTVPELQGNCGGYAMLACGFNTGGERLWECRFKTAYDCYGTSVSDPVTGDLLPLEQHNHRPQGPAKRVPKNQRFVIVSSSDDESEDDGDHSPEVPKKEVMEVTADTPPVTAGPEHPPEQLAMKTRPASRKKRSTKRRFKKNKEATPQVNVEAADEEQIVVDVPDKTTETESNTITTEAITWSQGATSSNNKEEEQVDVVMEELDEENADKESAMSPGVLTDILQGLDRSSIESLSFTCSGLRDFVEAKSDSLPLRFIQFARFARAGSTESALLKLATESIDLSEPPSRESSPQSDPGEIRCSMPKGKGLVERFFRALRFAAVEKIEVSNVRAGKTFLTALSTYGPAISIRHLFYDRVRDGGISLPDLFTPFRHIGTVDFRQCPALLPITNDDAVNQFAEKDFPALFLPRGKDCPVTEDALIRFCYHKWDESCRRQRTLNVFAPQVTSKFVHRLVEKGILEKHFGKVAGPPVALNIYFPVVEQDLAAYEQNKAVRKDGSYVLKFSGMQVTWNVPLRCLQFRWTNEAPAQLPDVTPEQEVEARKRRKSSGSKRRGPLPSL